MRSRESSEGWGLESLEIACDCGLHMWTSSGSLQLPQGWGELDRGSSTAQRTLLVSQTRSNGVTGVRLTS